VYVFALVKDAAAATFKAKNDSRRGALAAAGFSEQPKALSAVYRQVYSAQNFNIALFAKKFSLPVRFLYIL
jgi:hypothetical protein